MNERHKSDLDQECEGLELIDDSSFPPLMKADPAMNLVKAQSRYRQATKSWFASYSRSCVWYAECLKLELANRLASHIRGISVWPLIVVYIVAVIALSLLATALPIGSSVTLWSIPFGLMSAILVSSSLFLAATLVLLRDARKEPQTLVERIHDTD
jgi:hypothetical protein